MEVKELEVVGIESLGKTYNIKTDSISFEAKSVIISTGNKKIKPKIDGISKFEGKGISYCAICDAFFYKKKKIGVIGNGKFALSELKELSNIASGTVLLTNGESIPKTDFEVCDKKISKISGDTRLRSVEFEDGTAMELDGLFIALGEAGASDFAKTLGIMQYGDSIKVNEEMETNVKGIFACGNVTGGLLQVCKATYEGAKAGLSAVNYVRSIGKEE